jgi:hypothetical protein
LLLLLVVLLQEVQACGRQQASPMRQKRGEAKAATMRDSNRT